MAGDDQIPPIIRLCIFSARLALPVGMPNPIRGRARPERTPRPMMSDRTIALLRQAPSVADFSFVKFPEKFQCIGAVQF
jgi:hypothetical protein